jgi:hypothetical protein
MTTNVAAIRMILATVVAVAPVGTRMICTTIDDMATTETITMTTGPIERSQEKGDEEDALITPHHHQTSEILMKTRSEQRE